MSVAIKNESENDWDSKKDLIKRTICKGSSDEELELFLYTCKRTGLDPLMKQAYAVKRWSSADKREVMTIQTSIDGYRLIAERTGRYAPGREPTYAYDGENRLVSATSYVKKMTQDGTWHEVAATAFFNEYAQKNKEGKLTQFWEKMEHVMLAKCAETLALRRSFPAELAGIYTQEEMNNAVTVDQEEKQEKKEDEPKIEFGSFVHQIEKKTGETISHFALEDFVEKTAQKKKISPAQVMQVALSSDDMMKRFMVSYNKSLEDPIEI